MGGVCVCVWVQGHDEEDMESLGLWRDSAEDKSSMVVAVSKDTLYESNVRHWCRHVAAQAAGMATKVEPLRFVCCQIHLLLLSRIRRRRTKGQR